MRIGVITPTPTPYRDPFWSTVSKRPEVDLEVFYCGGVTQDRPWDVSWAFDFRAEVMPGRNLHKKLGYDACCYYNPGLPRRLREGQYDGLIFGGYNHVTMQIGLAYALLNRIPYFMMCEVYLNQPRWIWRKFVKTLPLRFLLTRAAGCFPTGTLAERYMRHYGVSEKRMCHVPNAPDVQAYWQQAQQLAPNRIQMRRETGFGDESVILFVGRLIDLKEVDTLLHAFAQVAKGRPCRLVILGDGPTQPRLERLSRDLGIAHLVSFPGFLPPDQLPKWYAMSDLFVLPSSDETWSVVVLEALASGVPVVITKMVGCFADVLNDPIVGEAVPPCDVVNLTRAIERRLAARVSRDEIANAWAPIRACLRYDVIAERMAKTLARCIGNSTNTRSAKTVSALTE